MATLTATDLTPWVQRAAAGDADAFARLVEATAGTVHAIALAILRDVHTAEDVAQEVFLSAWAGLGRLRNPDSFLPWLRQTTRFRARTRLRDEGRRRDRSGGDAFDDALAVVSDPRADSEGRLLDTEARRALRQALDGLPDEAREVLVLFYREERSSRQVAELLGLSDAAVRKRLSRARSELRQDVLERLGAAVRKSAPSTAFIGGVMATLGAPATATAATTAGVVAKTAGTGFLSKLLTVLPGVGAGAAGGSLGVILGLRRDLRQAADREERRRVLHLQRVTVAATVLAACGLPAAWILAGWVGEVAVFLSFLLYLGWAYLAWLPAIQARRRAAEIAVDPEAARRWRRKRIVSWIGLVVGLLSGGAALVLGLLAASG